MSNHFNKVTIENFKSIKKIDFDCKRINLFLGEPNVGKSNILEALALFSAPYSGANSKFPDRPNDPTFAWDQIRYKNVRNLFFFQDTLNPITVSTNKGIAKLKLHDPQSEGYEFFIVSDSNLLNTFIESHWGIDNRMIMNFIKSSSPGYLPHYYLHFFKTGDYQFKGNDYLKNYNGFVKKYVFNETLFERDHSNKYQVFLQPSYGSNVFTIVNGNDKLADLVSGFFEKYDLELIFISEKSEYVIQRKQGRVATQLPYETIADTLQRIIFHLAAIYSNKDSVLIFEEPESHSFPDYIQLLATKIIESESNQFFITTHSPYLVQKLLQGLDQNELSVNAVGYKDHQTLIQPIRGEEIDKMIDRGSDVFFNLPAFNSPPNYTIW